MEKVYKQFDIEVTEKRESGGRITISTPAIDRDHDRIVPGGVKIDNYMRNPVVQWGHNYRDPWATIGKTNSLEIADNGIVADFDLRPAANENDPQNIVQLLWDGNWIRTASVGFMPTVAEENDVGGRDYTEWEILEWSLVPVPANQEALRLAVKGLGTEAKRAIPYSKHPLADRGAAWNGPREVAAADVAALKVMCAWYDAENADVKSAYKLPHHRAADK